MFGRNYLRHSSSCVHKGDDNANDKKKFEFLALKRLHVDGAKVLATAVSTAVFCIGLFHNELKKLKRDIRPLHDIFDFEKNLDSYITAPNYLGNSPEVSTMKKYLKNFVESKSIWDLIPTRTILKCTHSKDPVIKKKALEILSQRSCFEDADRLMISQAIDFPTSLYLARSFNIDRRLFRPPFKLPPSKQSVEAELTNLVDDMARIGDCEKQQQFVHSLRKRKIRALSHIEKTVMLGFETFDEVAKESQKSFESQIIVFLLQAILNYSQDDANCKHLIGQGVLTTLRRAYENAPEDLIFISLITKILNNLILNGTNPKLLFETGWFHIILKWTESKYESVRLKATKILVNMDLACSGHLDQVYDNHVCLLHPTHRHQGLIEADVVFIHGIRGGPVKTWRQRDKKSKSHGKNNNNNKNNNHNNNNNHANNKNNNHNNNNNHANNNNNNHDNSNNNINNNNNNSLNKSLNNKSTKEEPSAQNKHLLNSSENQNVEDVIFIDEDGDDDDDDTKTSADYTQCWPKDWLPQDLSNVRVLSVDYDTQLTHWASKDHIERKTLKEQAELLLDSLSKVGVGSRPVVLVGHSMGGLLIKQMLCMAAEKQMQLTNHVKGIVFYSVPHRGSYLINRTRNASYLIHPTDALLQLAEGSTDLKDLQEKFSELMEQGSIKVRSFTEGRSTNLPFYMKATIVSPQSSAPGFGDFFVVKDHDHVTICKPKSKDSLLYKLTRDFIKQCLYE